MLHPINRLLRWCATTPDRHQQLNLWATRPINHLLQPCISPRARGKMERLSPERSSLVCRRYGLSSEDWSETRVFFQFDKTPNWSPRNNISPSQDPSLKIPAINRRNTRLELVLTSWDNEAPSCRADSSEPHKQARVAVPASWFFAWQVLPNEKQQQPWLVSFKDHKLFFIGAVLSNNTLQIVTTEASHSVKSIDNRQPVLFRTRLDVLRWLRPDTSSEVLEEMMGPIDGSQLNTYPVSTYVNRAGNDGPECIEPVELDQRSLALSL